jgi:prepilin-type N-terminal cleavage/methylation domain-containing protein
MGGSARGRIGAADSTTGEIGALERLLGKVFVCPDRRTHPLASSRPRSRTPALPRPHAPARAFTRRSRAFTLVEVLMTILVVGVGLTACMRALPIIVQMSRASHESLAAQQLATDLLSEISMLPYQDPDGNVIFGREPTEPANSRAAFDDIDDYDGWSASPPQKKDGTVLSDFAGYARSVVVQSVSDTNFANVAADSQALPKRITITVSKPGAPTITIVTVRFPGANREDLY